MTQILMSVLKELTNVMSTAIIQLVAITATVLDLAIDFTVTALLVKVSHMCSSTSSKLHCYLILYEPYYIDVDECAEDTDGCAQICMDTDGSYFCSCEIGYNLAEDQHDCDGKK